MPVTNTKSACLQPFRLLLLYFLPGIIPTIALMLYYLLGSSTVPAIFVFLVVELLVTLPFFFWLMTQQEQQPLRLTNIKQIIEPQQCVSGKKMTLLCTLLLVWAVGCFVMLSSISSLVQEKAFYWLPQWFDLGDYLINPSQYASYYPYVIWYVMIISSIVFPFAEELYFRGYLMQKTNQLGAWSPIINTMLFACYHLWSIWMVPVRVIATLPLYYFVWKERNLFIGVIVHCLLNLVGDVVLVYPLLFG